VSYNNDNHNLEDDRGFLQRYGFVLGIAGLVLLVVIIFVGPKLFSKHGSGPRRNQEIVMIKLPPPPATPPPIQKPPEPPKVKEEMIEQEHVDVNESKPDDAPKSDPVSTGIKGGNGPDMGLGSGGGNTSIGGGQHHGKWGWYAAQVQSKIEDALRSNSKTRSSKIQIMVRIWVDSDTGRITRAELAGSLGDPTLESAIKNEVLNGLQLQEPPPKDMKMPINMRLTARRPS